MATQETRDLICVGGPMAGRSIRLQTTTHKLLLADIPDMAYHVTRPTGTNWRETYNPAWWSMGEPEPVKPDRVLEWHEVDWVSPEVAMIRVAVNEAADR